jgi:hypothetical protein
MVLAKSRAAALTLDKDGDVMIEHAICIACGEEKAHPFDPCGACKLTPAPGEQQIKSLYLSEYRYSDGEQMEKWLDELESIAAQLQRSQSFDYDPSELKRMAAVDARIRAIPPSAAWGALFRFFLPAIILLAALWGIVFVLRAAD